MLDAGQAAPDFTLKSHENEVVTLSSFKGGKWVVLHTFPAAFTGG
jgi:peroxiredoxin